MGLVEWRGQGGELMTGWEQGLAPLGHRAFWRNASQTRPVRLKDSKKSCQLEWSNRHVQILYYLVNWPFTGSNLYFRSSSKTVKSHYLFMLYTIDFFFNPLCEFPPFLCRRRSAAQTQGKLYQICNCNRGCNM